MKNKIKWISIALLSVVLIFGFTGCPEGGGGDDGPKLSSKAEVTSIYFGNGISETDTSKTTVEFKLGTVMTTAPSGSLLNNAGSVTIRKTDDLREPITLTVIDSKAKVKFAISTASAPQTTAYTYNSGDSVPKNVTFNGAGSHYITAQVTAENGTKRYYSFRVWVLGTNSELEWVRIDTQGQEDLGVPSTGLAVASTDPEAVNADWTKVTAGKIGLTGALVSGKLTAGVNSTNIKFNKIEWAVAAEGDNNVPTTFATIPDGGASPSPSWADEDKIYIKVTSENAEMVSFYIINVEVGRIADVKEIKVFEVDLTFFGTPQKVTKANVGDADPAPTASAIIKGTAEPKAFQPPRGYTIRVYPEDSAAIAYIGKGTETTPPTTFDEYLMPDNRATLGDDPDSPTWAVLPNYPRFIFDQEPNDYLWIKVLSANKKVINYYKLEVVQPRMGKIIYGSPLIVNPNNKEYIDNAFLAGDLETYDASRVNTAEQTPRPNFYDTANGEGHTSAWAKALWDDDGISFYVNVDFQDFNISGTPIVRVLKPGSEHDCDSIEFFVNERFQTFTTGNYGAQYRVGPQNDGSSAISGVAGNYGPGEQGLVDAFKNSQQYNSWIKKDPSGKQTGYVVIAKVPWGFFDDQVNASNVFDSEGFVKLGATDADGPKIGFEVQLNVAGNGPTRECILTWNGVGGQSYQNVSNYGQAQLILAGRTRTKGVGAPDIAVQPVGRTYKLAQLSDPLFTQYVTVGAKPSGTQTFQWYKAATATDTTGAPAVGTGATTARFKPDVSVGEGTHYYFVKVTNTRGTYVETRTSNTIAIVVEDVPVTPADDLIGDHAVFTDRGNYDVVVGDTGMAALISSNYFTVAGTAVLGTQGTDFVYVTLAAGGDGANHLVILPPASASLPAGNDYFIKIRGRTQGQYGGGRIQINPATGGDFTPVTDGEFLPNFDIPSGFNTTIALTAEMVTKGIKIYTNKWSGDPLPANFAISIDDYYIYKAAPPVCESLTCALKGKTIAEAAGLFCDCYDFSCVICDNRGVDPAVTGAVAAGAPLILTGANGGLIFEDGNKDTAVVSDAEYGGISAKIAPATFTNVLDLYKYNRVSVVAEAWSDDGMETLITTGWNATLFNPWKDYTSSGFPDWTPDTGKNGRILSIGPGDVTNGKAAALTRLPEGLRIERTGFTGANAIKIIGLVFWNSADPWDGNL